ncbi:hypothetical protein CCACVL1_10474, partial [Corchorus capsularis]
DKQTYQFDQIIIPAWHILELRLVLDKESEIHTSFYTNPPTPHWAPARPHFF